jgi:tyrosine-protein kinase Etk/Wzc
MSQQIQPVRSDQSSFNIKEFIFKYIRFLPLFIFSAILSYTVGFLYLRYTSETYRVTGSLILKDNNSSSGATDPRFQQLFVDDRTKNIQNEIEYLKSRPMMERVVEGLKLNFSYYAKGKIKQENVYQKAPFLVEAMSVKDSAAFKWNVHFVSQSEFRIGEEKRIHTVGETFSTPNGTFRFQATSSTPPSELYVISWAPTGSVASALIPTLAVAPKQSGSILVMTMEGDNAQLCSDVLNRLMAEYQKATVEDKNSTTLQTIQFLDGRIRIVSRELDSVTNRLLAFQQANDIGMINAEGDNPFVGKSDAADEKIKEQQMQLYTLGMIRDYLGDSRNVYNLVPSTLNVTDAVLSGLIGAYNATQLERKALLDAGVAAENPRVRQKEEGLERLRANVFESVRNLTRAFSATMGRYQQEQAGLQARMRTLPAKMQDLAEIKRQQANKQAIYDFLSEKREESSISLAATISNIKVLEKAYPNTTPVTPNRGATKSIALVIGLLIPALFIFIIELLDDKISNRNDIEKNSTVPILGEVGHSTGITTLAVQPKSRAFVAEQFRIIRSNLQFIIGTTPSPVILVSSSFSGEGKSFVSTNLGAVHALAGKKTIILEFDIRKPKVLSGLGMDKKPGLTNYMMGKLSVEELPVPVPEVENLYVLPCGPIPPNPAELLLEARIDDLFAYLKANFDIIVMDTAPIGIVSDALALSKYVDASIYIVRQGVTHKKQLELVNDLTTEAKLPRISIILNDIRTGGGYGYYSGYGRYGYGYGYGTYGYGYGYFEDAVQERSFLQRVFGIKKKKATNKTV